MATQTTAPAPSDSDQVAWWNLWGKLQQAAKDLDAAVVRLQSQQAFAMSRPELASSYAQQMADIQTARDRVTWWRDSIRTVLGFFGVNLSGLGSLGFIWIPITAAIAGVAYVAKVAADAWALSKTIDEQQRLEARGVAPTQAAQIAQGNARAATGTGGTGTIAQLGTTAILAAAGLAGLWWWMNRRRS